MIVLSRQNQRMLGFTEEVVPAQDDILVPLEQGFIFSSKAFVENIRLMHNSCLNGCSMSPNLWIILDQHTLGNGMVGISLPRVCMGWEAPPTPWSP